ncbi:MAG: hypothetical protein KC543_10635 [Myxococcales bacterium]|nr:hypothetical protein [Myxococcales bacterium]
MHAQKAKTPGGAKSATASLRFVAALCAQPQEFSPQEAWLAPLLAAESVLGGVADWSFDWVVDGAPAHFPAAHLPGEHEAWVADVEVPPEVDSVAAGVDECEQPAVTPSAAVAIATSECFSTVFI